MVSFFIYIQLLLVLYAAFTDLLTLRIPNFIPLAIGCVYLATCIVRGTPIFDVAIQVGLAAMILIVGFVLFSYNLIGGGDAKFVSAVTLILYANDLFYYFLLSSILGGGLTIIILFYRKLPLDNSKLYFQFLKKHYDPTNGVPYGIALAGSALYFLTQQL